MGGCVIIWLSQPSHELFGPGSGTEAGFVQAFVSPSVISSHNCMQPHTNAAADKREETRDRGRGNGHTETDEKDRLRWREQALRPIAQDKTDHLHFTFNTEFFHLI